MLDFIEIVLCLFAVYGGYSLISCVFRNAYRECKKKEKEDGYECK